MTYRSANIRLTFLNGSPLAAAHRDGPEAVRLAGRAGEATGCTPPRLIGPLAAALPLEDVAGRNRKLIRRYRQGQPFHEQRRPG